MFDIIEKIWKKYIIVQLKQLLKVNFLLFYGNKV